MSDLFDVTRKQFQEVKFAEALLFKSADGTRRSLRIEADSLGLELTDKVYFGVVVIPPRPPFGRDPEGFLYYNDLKDFTAPSACTYTVTQEINPADGRDCLRVKFAHGNVEFAQFLSHDRYKVVTQTTMHGLSQPGEWAEMNTGHATAILSKTANGPVTLTARSIGRQATITSGGAIFNSQSFTSEGTLTFKELSKISSGTVVSCNNDRLLFFGTAWQNDFTAFFIPHDISPGALGFDQASSNSFADTELSFGITWS